MQRSNLRKRCTKRARRAEERRRREAAEKEKREAEEQERQRKWEKCWEKKLEEQEMRDNADCCRGQGLCLRPRTQSNIWINVTRDKEFQEVQMSFKHVPVPRPKPPPLPPLKRDNIVHDISYSPCKPAKKKKKAKKVDKGVDMSWCYKRK